MPTYAYQCQECGHAFDIFQKFAEDPLTVCDQCQGRIRRVIHPTPVVFKGSGWYINDSKVAATKSGADAKKADGDGKAGKGDTADKAEKNGKSDGKGEPAAKTATSETKSDSKGDKVAPAAGATKTE